MNFPYKPCPICHATLSAQAIICPYCEEQLLPPEESKDCMYGEAVLLADIMPDSDDFLDMVDGVCNDDAMREEPREDRMSEEW